MDKPDPLHCNSSYVPTSTEYFAALGSASSTIGVISGLITLGLFILFIEQFIYTNQNVHHGAKRHIYWITSVFPVMTLMSMVALYIPRAHYVCLSVKMVYMSIGLSHFTDLTTVMFGGEQQMVQRANGDTFSLQLSPLCCCCRCLPTPSVTKYSLRLVVLLTDQLPFVQSCYYITIMVLLSADNVTLGDVAPTGAFLWLNILKLTSALAGVYGFMILSKFSRAYLVDFEYWKKSRSLRLLLLITNFQSTIFSVMANYGAFPCIPPYVSPSVYKQTVENCVYLVEMMILAPYTFYQYHDQKFATPIDTLSYDRSRSNSTCSCKNSITDTISTVVAAEVVSSDSEDDKNTPTVITNQSTVIEMEKAEDEGKAVTTNTTPVNSKRKSSKSLSSDSNRREENGVAGDVSRSNTVSRRKSSQRISRKEKNTHGRNKSKESTGDGSDQTRKDMTDSKEGGDVSTDRTKK